MPSSGSRHPHLNTGYYFHSTQKKEECTWTFLQPQFPHPKTTSDYKKTSFAFDVKKVHPVDHMDMHMKTGKMIFSTLTNTSLIAAKMQVSLNNV
jgi:hypothetical protein